MEITATREMAVLLGYSVKECSVTYADMENFLKEEGLDRFLPRKPNPANVFRRVTSSLAGVYHKDNLRYKIDVIKITETVDPIERVVMAVEVDEKNREISEGKKIARLQFNRVDGSFGYITADYTPGLFARELNDDLSPIPDFIYNEIKLAGARIKEQLSYLSPAQVRDTFFNILKSVGIPSEGIPMLWTVHGKKEETITAFCNLADSVNSVLDKKSVYYRIEGISDNIEKREVVSTDAVAYATSKFKKLLLEETEKIQTSDEPDKAYKKAQERFSKESGAIISLIKEYEDIIGDNVRKIEEAKKEFERNLSIFDVVPELMIA